MYKYDTGLTVQEVYDDLHTRYEMYGATDYSHGVGTEHLCKGMRSILDVGGGRSGYARAVAKTYGMKVVEIVDISPIAVAAQKKRGLSARVADVSRELPYIDRACDVVVCFDVLEHIAEPEVYTAMRELVRCANKRVLITVGIDVGKHKGPNGEQLHLTVKEWSWWLRKIREQCAGMYSDVRLIRVTRRITQQGRLHPGNVIVVER